MCVPMFLDYFFILDLNKMTGLDELYLLKRWGLRIGKTAKTHNFTPFHQLPRFNR